MPGRAEELLLLMNNQANKLLETKTGKEKIIPLLNWLEKVTIFSENKFEYLNNKIRASSVINLNIYANLSAPIRIYFMNNFGCYNFFRVINHITTPNTHTEYHITIDMYDNMINYLLGIKKDKIFTNLNIDKIIDILQSTRSKILQNKNRTLSTQEELKFAKQFVHDWHQVFHINKDQLSFTVQEIKDIFNPYFYLNSLITECAQSAIMISPYIWHEIIYRMLTVPEHQKNILDNPEII